MNIQVNNAAVAVPENLSVSALLAYLNYTGTCAVWINDQQIFQQDYPARIVAQNDRVKLVKILGGG